MWSHLVGSRGKAPEAPATWRYLNFVSATFLLVCFLILREHLWNKEKRFLFLFKSSFCSWEDQILDFQISKFYEVITWYKEYLQLNDLGSIHSLIMKFSCLCHISKKKKKKKKKKKNQKFLQKLQPEDFLLPGYFAN